MKNTHIKAWAALAALTAACTPLVSQAASACFYELPNYGGAEFCAQADNGWVGSAWNDRFRSVRLAGDTSVTVFEHANFGGTSVVLKQSVGDLATLNFSKQVSSFFIRATPTNGNSADLSAPEKKTIAMKLVSSAENSSLDWEAQYAYIEDIGDGRGYTAGIIGFCSGTGDMLDVVTRYASLRPGNELSGYLSALRAVNGSDSHAGLDPNFPSAWRRAAQDGSFRQAQDSIRDAVYFNPAVAQAKADGLQALGQFIYYDALVMHGPGDDSVSFGGIRKAAKKKAKTPAEGGNETAYLDAFLNARVAAMKTEEAHEDTSRVDTAQRKFLREGNLDLHRPLRWAVYGEEFRID